MSKQLLIEYATFTPTKRLNEGLSNRNGNMIVSGLVQACDKPNANRRIYPYAILREQVEKYIDGPVSENRALGELDHPESSIVNLKNVSHNIKRLYWEGKDLHGEIEILPTPSGNILKELFKNNITVGISSRAMGSVTPIGEGLVQVEDDLDLICWDFVSQPSTYGAYMKPTSGLNESLDRTLINENKYANANKMISEIICNVSGECCIR
jgi:hypothetical protein